MAPPDPVLPVSLTVDRLVVGLLVESQLLGRFDQLAELVAGLALAAGHEPGQVSLFGRPTSVELDYTQLKGY